MYICGLHFEHMEISILNQGFNADNKNSVGEKLIFFLGQKDFHSFTGISAFASPSGIEGLHKYILKAKDNFRNISFIVGIDDQGTSKEALDSLLSIGVNSYVFYQKSPTIFHPKIYLFEGDKTSQLIVGSSNLTARGLFTNIETSLLIGIDNTVKNERKIIEDLKAYYKGIFNYKDPNLKKLTPKLINRLVKINLVPTETERKSNWDAVKQSASKEFEKLIFKIFPKREIAKIPSNFRVTRKASKKSTEPKNKTVGKSSLKGNLVWTRKNLPASSVQDAGTGTAPTGGLRLVQDKYKVEGKVIDQTTYFRNVVFGNFKWEKVKANPYVELASVPFEITIMGKFQGKHTLDIRHKPSGEAGQHNYTTSISWGNIGEIISKSTLTGKRLDLYSPMRKNGAFQFVIS